MKKIIKQSLIVSASVLCGGALYLGALNSSTSQTSIWDLIQTSDADAECQTYNGWEYGRCLQTLGGFCVFDTEAKECSPG